MSLKLRWLPRARKDLKRLDPPVQLRVIEAVEQFCQSGHGDVVRLAQVNPPEYRLRVGSWRVRFTRDEDSRVLSILRVLPRGKAYR